MSSFYLSRFLSTFISKEDLECIRVGFYFLFDFCSLEPCFTEPLKRDTIVQNERDFIHSLSLLFITEEMRGSLWKKGDLINAGRRGGKENEDLNVFFRPFLSSPPVI